MTNETSEWGLVRIDDRLIHGQVVAGWARSKKFSLIHIVDDALAADPFMVDVLSLSAPAGLKVVAENFPDSVNSLRQNRSPQETMILMKSPATALALWETGIRYTALNVGGLGITPGRKKVFQDISLSAEEYRVLRQLQVNGVKITFLSVPGEPSKDFSDLSEII